MKVSFADFFDVDPKHLDDYGAVNMSLINDIPLFIDPFLIFASPKEEYKIINKNMEKYIVNLYTIAQNEGPDSIKDLCLFPEIKQNWFGYSRTGNQGSGLGKTFAGNFSKILPNIMNKGQANSNFHIERALLFRGKIGRDNISDFTCNLCKDYLLTYTQDFALKYLKESQIKKIQIQNVIYNYENNIWEPKEFILPFFNNDYIILTPKDIVTKDETWINKKSLYDGFNQICNSLDNETLKKKISRFYTNKLPKKGPNKRPTIKEETAAIEKTIEQFPAIVDEFIKQKEEKAEVAILDAREKISSTMQLLIVGAKKILELVAASDFNRLSLSSKEEAMKKISILKDVIENRDGYRIFYQKGIPVRSERDLQILFRFVVYSSNFDINFEVNNGRGPVDSKVSWGSKDKTLIEFKLASNTSLERNLKNQVEIYEKANGLINSSIKVILFFKTAEYENVKRLLKKHKLDQDPSYILIDARAKESASKA